MAQQERKKIVVTLRKKVGLQQQGQQQQGHRPDKDKVSTPTGGFLGGRVRRDDDDDDGAVTATDADTPQPQQPHQYQSHQRKRRRVVGQGCGLPSFASSSSARPHLVGRAQPQPKPQNDVDRDDVGDYVAEAPNVFDDDDDDDVEEVMPCETMMVLTSLLNDPSRRVAVPIQRSGGHNIYGASPSHLYKALDGQDPVVLGELRHLLQSNVVCKLRLPPHVGALSSSSTTGARSTAAASTAVVRAVAASDPHHHLLLLKSEYRRAAYESVLPELDPNRSSVLATDDDDDSTNATAAATQLRNIVEWFLDESNVVDTVSEQELEDKLRKSSSRAVLPSSSIVLSKLQSLQLLRSLSGPGTNPNQSRTVFQLWLPSWGLVVQAWEKASTNLVMHLKRSQYKERSYRSLVGGTRNDRSPIPVDVLVEHLVSQGVVVKVERPAGTFVRLVGP